MSKVIELTKSEEKELFFKIKKDIIQKLENMSYDGHIDDLANEIGIAVSNNTCKNNKDLNIWSFEKESFIGGFEHGYSLNDGTH